MVSRRIASVLALALLWPFPAHSQSASERLQTGAPVAHRTGRIDTNATAAELENHADELRAAKEYFDAEDYYRAALAKNPKSAVLYNKMGINELISVRLRTAKSDFDHAIKLDRDYAPAYNNLGVVEYASRKYGRAIKEYEKAISLQPNDASYYSNLGTAYFSKKQWEKATQAYSRAVTLDPNVFDTGSRSGIAGQIASPQDRAHFSYELAKLYANKGMADRSLECLRRALEEGYKHVEDVYSDAAFSQLRKDPRFRQLMSSRPLAIPE
jgi:tetratricopeptide (TPR) repeat protein